MCDETRGRPLKMTPEKIKEICQYVSDGNSFETAIKLSCVSRSTFYDWKKTGKEDFKNGKNTEQAAFAVSLEKAEAEFKKTCISRIKTAGKDHWQACAWLLERKYPEEYGRRDRLSITGTLTTANVDIKLTEKQEQEYIQRLGDAGISIVQKCEKSFENDLN